MQPAVFPMIPSTQRIRLGDAGKEALPCTLNWFCAEYPTGRILGAQPLDGGMWIRGYGIIAAMISMGGALEDLKRAGAVLSLLYSVLPARMW
ncbi:MAG: hypothetical protein ACLR0U_13515 [Enterocloster clostridioformis]